MRKLINLAAALAILAAPAAIMSGNLDAAQAKSSKERTYKMNGKTYVCSGSYTGTVVCRAV